MNQDFGKTHHRKSVSNKGYLKNRETQIQKNLLDSIVIKFCSKYTDGCILQNKAFAKQKTIQNTYLLLKIRLRTLIWLSSHLNLPEIGEKCRLTATTPIYAILFGTWLGPSNMAATP